MTSADQVSRLLALVPYLQHHPDAELEATAEVFGVSSRQLIADLNVLWYCGLPGGGPGDLIEIDMDAVTDSGRIRLSNADYLDRPMRFTPDEALSLVVALRTVRELAPASAAPGIDSALAKLEQATGTVAVTTKVAVASGSAELRDLLAQAISESVLVKLEYTDAGQELSTPVVAPVRLIVRDGFGYLQAWSLDRQAWRTYRLDRISSAEPTAQPAPALPEPPEFGPGWLEQRPEAAEVTLRLRTEAAWVAEYYPIRHVRRGEDWLEVDLLVADPGWLRSLLLRLGRAVLSIQPEQAGDAAAEAAAEALGAYQAG
ncbi:proteasome accessory factor C [Propionicimonas paludicola]|uniref:Proteasome accessory factor C n=1 Tax=Propionicimonas paludicola TaxID=185243 RepID=A0A2A9CQ47_9ACTN|nr:WYL domain-containing protein [Propionicimonas paludicola]PFG16523.1 proteasome accessory factor C [Propionicimonas paludicola]